VGMPRCVSQSSSTSHASGVADRSSAPDCGYKGVCYSCSLSCHAGTREAACIHTRSNSSTERVPDHSPLDCRLVELFQRRNFTCDCPTSYSDASPSTRPAHRCTLRQGPQPLEPNSGNRYGPNFRGEFCRCGRPYNPETENESMICCLACEVSWASQANSRPRYRR
jgi:E3 ubiquitin-protein ligase UBR7